VIGRDRALHSALQRRRAVGLAEADLAEIDASKSLAGMAFGKT
jgi:hypothetical protein